MTLPTIVFTTLAASMTALPAANASISTLATGTSVASLDEVKIRLSARGSGQTWRGSLGDEVAVTTSKRGKKTVFQGRLLNYREVGRNLATVTVEGTEDGKTQTRTFIVSDIVKIETISEATEVPTSPSTSDDDGGTATAVSQRTEQTEPNATKTPAPATTHAWGFPTDPGNGDPNLPKVFLLPIEGGVGDGTRHDEMKQIGEIADTYGPGQIIVLRVKSPGGLVAEADLIHETLVDLKKRHQLVAWVEEAISAAAFTSLHCNQIYFMKTGALGSATMFAGGKAIEGEQLNQWVKKFGDVAEESGHPRAIAEAMCTNREMCSYDPAEGDKGPVVYDTMEGKVPLSTNEENLTINAYDAVACGLADGVADNEAELAEQLRLPRWYETTDDGRKIHKAWQKQLEMSDVEVPRLLRQLQGQTGQTNDPIKNLNRQLTACNKLMGWARRFGMHTSMMKNIPPLEYLEQIKKQIQEQIRRLKDQQRG